MDIKLFAKIIALRLIPHLQKLIHLDQVGFMPTREARDGTIYAINVIHSALSKNDQSFILSTDAEKAFDRVDWTFIRLTLETIGLGPHMRSWTETLYSNPSAQIRVTGILSSSFSITNGTRQGCPLSPLIFILVLEPFLRTICAKPDISGIFCGTQEHK